MNPKTQQPKLNIDIKATTPFITEDGNYVLVPGVIFRKVSRFLSGTDEDGLIPLEVFYDVKTGKIVTDLLPKELREEYKKLQEGK